MSETLILNQLHPDMVCAVALTLIEDNRVVANLESVTLHDARQQPLGTVRNWLRPDDPLHAATIAYLTARREASKSGEYRPGRTGWAAASAIKGRDEANARAREARALGRQLLAERGVLARARAEGRRIAD